MHQDLGSLETANQELDVPLRVRRIEDDTLTLVISCVSSYFDGAHLLPSWGVPLVPCRQPHPDETGAQPRLFLFDWYNSTPGYSFLY